MLKKMIAILTVCAMLAPLSSAVAADNTTVTPTIEEILNEYHAKDFEARMAAENGGASTYARGGNGQTLEQETVDALTEAGYEAYNVTGDNYDSVEETLNTDMTSLGLNTDGSYIVVVSGEDPVNHSNPNARAILPPTQEDFGDEDDVGGKPYFEYVYNGTTYRMRYVAVETTGADERVCDTMYSPTEPSVLNLFLSNLFSSAIYGTVDALYEEIPLGTLASLLLISPDDNVFTEISPGSFSIHATTYWTSIFIQVWDADEASWITAQSSEFTISMVRCVGSKRDSNAPVPIPVQSNPIYFRNYSQFYFDENRRKSEAMKGYDAYTVYSDTVDRVDFYIYIENGEVAFTNGGEPLFSHTRRLIPHLSDSYEN